MNKPIAANVFIYGMRVGEIVHHPTEGIFFQYDRNFLSRGINISPKKLKHQKTVIRIDPNLQKVRCFAGLPGVFADSLPDKFGNELLSQHFQEKGFNPAEISPVQKLLYVGDTGMGALEYRPMEKDRSTSTLLPLEVRTLVEQARKVIKGEIDKKIPEIMLVGSSVGGARAKGLVGWNRSNNEVVAGIRNLPKDFEHWIIKFDDMEKSTKGWGKIEFSYSEMARLAGIDMSETCLMPDGYNMHFMAKRFDRIDGTKIHMHSLCGMLEIDYDQHRLFDYANFIRLALEVTKHTHDVEQIYRRMIFNILARNQDDHLKNFSFLMSESGAWRLSPAYDLCYSVGNWCDDNQLTIQGKLGGQVALGDLLEMGKTFGIKRPLAIIEQIDSAICQWEQLASTNQVDPQIMAEIKRAHRERRNSVGIQ